MADKKYKLNFEMSDGSVQSVEFTVPQGDPGADGKSAYDYAKTGGYTGTETDFYEALAKITDVLQQVTTYFITTNLTGVTGASSNPTMISEDDTATLTFTANSGYRLPDAVTVVGATSNWNKSTGKLTLSKPTGNVTIAIVAEKIIYSIATNLTEVTGTSSNPTTITIDVSASLTFTANAGYKLPDTVVVSGATFDWNKITGKLTLSNPTGNIAINIAAEKIVYSISTSLTDVTGASSNPTTISYGGSTSLSFTANDGCVLPGAITVSGAAYTWDPESGLLSLTNPTENVSVVITGVTSDNYIMFLGDDGDFTIKATNVEWDGTVEYSTDKSTWKTWDGSAISSSDKHLYMRGSKNTKFYTSGGMQLVLSAKAGCYGNLNTLLEYRNPPSKLTTKNGFQSMFENCVHLTHAPELPATTLYSSCYQQMFCGCTSLTQAPELPATGLAPYCYYKMFYGCTSLTQAPKLPATTLKNFCYQAMFYGCTSLAQAPDLPATTATTFCYYQMFYGCTRLTQAPDLPATTLGSQCYYGMFYGCTGLTQAPKLPATTLVGGCYYSMFHGCTSLAQAPELPAMTLGDYCYQDMFYGCTSLTRVPKLPAMTLGKYCYQRMFSGCTSLTQVPELPATTLIDGCYYSMFQNCKGIKLSVNQTGEYQTAYCIPPSGTGTTATDALTYMFSLTGGTFIGTPTINTTYYGTWSNS